MVMSAAERQRKRRRNLKEHGVIDVTLKVPESSRESLLALAKDLRKHPERQVAANRLARVIAALRANQGALKQSGVKHAAVFGSTVRGEDRPDSDIDILVDYEKSKVNDLYVLMNVMDGVRDIIKQDYPDIEVDVVNCQTLKNSIRDAVKSEALYVF